MSLKRTAQGLAFATMGLVGLGSNASAQAADSTRAPDFTVDIHRGETPIQALALFNEEGDSIREMRIPREGDQLMLREQISQQYQAQWGQWARFGHVHAFDGTHITALKPQDFVVETSQDIPLELRALGDWALLEDPAQYATQIVGPNGRQAYLIKGEELTQAIHEAHKDQPHTALIHFGLRQVLTNDADEEGIEALLIMDHSHNIEQVSEPDENNHKHPTVSYTPPRADTTDAQPADTIPKKPRARESSPKNALSIGFGYGALNEQFSVARKGSSNSSYQAHGFTVDLAANVGETRLYVEALRAQDGTFTLPEVVESPVEIDLVRGNVSHPYFRADGEFQQRRVDQPVGVDQTETQWMGALGPALPLGDARLAAQYVRRNFKEEKFLGNGTPLDGDNTDWTTTNGGRIHGEIPFGAINGTVNAYIGANKSETDYDPSFGLNVSANIDRLNLNAGVDVDGFTRTVQPGVRLDENRARFTASGKLYLGDKRSR